MNPSVTLLIATRGRPKRFKNAVDSAFSTCETDVRLIWYVDEDDPGLAEYADMDYGTRIIGESKGSSKALLQMLEMVETPYFMVGSDDIQFETKGWDGKFLSAMPKDDLAVLYGSDHAKQNCNHFFSSMKWHRLVGMWPDIFRHFGPDGWVTEVGKLCNRLIKVPDIVVEHLHYKYGKGEVDETYLRARRGGDGSTSLKLISSMHDQQLRDAKKILSAISEFHGQRA